MTYWRRLADIQTSVLTHVNASLNSQKEYTFENTTSPATPRKFKVPNIVHYTWYADEKTPMAFKHYIGVLSAHKVLRPEKIYLHTNISRAPGKYWDKIVALETVEAINDGSPVALFENPLVVNGTVFPQDFSDLARMKYLMKYGGIYLDFDILVIKTFDKYRRNYEFTVGQEQDRKTTYDLLNNGIIISTKDAPFLYLWANSFEDDYQPKRWIYNCGVKLTRLWKRFPKLIHVEPTKFHRPNWRPGEVDKIWGENMTFDWKANYAVHTFFRFRETVNSYKKLYGDLSPDENDIINMNNTFAEIAKYTLAL